MTKSKGGSVNLPYLNLYVHQMNRYKLDKEKRALINRLAEIEKQLNDIDSKCMSLGPEIMTTLGEKPKRRKRGKDPDGNGRRRVVKKLKVSY